MLDLQQIETFYPEELRPFKKNILREYLQYKILEIIYGEHGSERLVFMGGTALRIIHSLNRFSEDLDFDNRGLTPDDFERLSERVALGMRREGYTVDVKTTYRKAFRAQLRFGGILFSSNISVHLNEVLTIQLDASPQNVEYEPNRVIINKFDVFCRLAVTPADLLLSHKLYAILHRPRTMGRDFYDALYLFGKVASPRMAYFKTKMRVDSWDELRKLLLRKCRDLDFQQLAKDVEPFLSTPGSSQKVLLFPDFIRDFQTKLS